MLWAKVRTAAAAVACIVTVGGGAVAVAQVAPGGGAQEKKVPATTGSKSSVAESQPVGNPAPINEYKGMQEREEVFEFTAKPSVEGRVSSDPSAGSRLREDATAGTAGQGGKKTWTISFASKGKCDATVSIVDTNGIVVRHLALGVLGVVESVKAASDIFAPAVFRGEGPPQPGGTRCARVRSLEPGCATLRSQRRPPSLRSTSPHPGKPSTCGARNLVRTGRGEDTRGFLPG